MDLAPESPPALARAGCVATIALNRPSRRNALDDGDLRTLLALLREVDADAAVRVLVLRAHTAGAARPVFCAGYHVGGFDEAVENGPRLFEQAGDALEALRPITVCALAGSVYGGATDLVLGCDLRVALAGSEWRMPAAALGLHYAPGGLRRYVSRFGLDLAKRAFLGARAMPVEQLASAGVFAAVAEAASFEAELAAVVEAAAALAPLAAQGMKRSLNEIAAGRADEATLRAREAATLASADFAEGRAAFAERRAPRFSGR